MDNVFMNSENRKTSNSRRLLSNLLDKLKKINTLLYQILAYTIHEKKYIYIKKSYKNNKFKISAQTWNYKFELPDELYSV